MTSRHILLWLAIALACASCLRKKEPVLGEQFSDEFERTTLGPDWRPTGGSFTIEDGVLKAQDCYNHTLWLRRRLPRDVEVGFEAWSDGADGDIKFELFGDGHSTSTGEGAYTATGYVLVLGGWHNTLSIIARMDEHADNRKVTRKIKVEPGKRYRMRARRTGRKLSWWVDGALLLEFDDPEPLEGGGHEYFGFNNWEAPVSFDNLVIRPL
jgi:hypothetical protein